MDVTIPTLESDVDSTIVEEVLARERLRCAALLNADHKALDDLLSDDLVHIHATAKIEGKAAYIDAVGTRMVFISIKRSDLRVRVFENFAVMTGTVEQCLRLHGRESLREMTAIATQIWAKRDGNWKQCSFQLTEPR